MTKGLDIFEVSKRLAEMAAADGVISAAERQLLKGFAEDNGIDGRRLIRMAYALAGKVGLPEVEPVGPAEMKGSFDEIYRLCVVYVRDISDIRGIKNIWYVGG